MSGGLKRSLNELLVIDVDQVPVVATDDYPIAGVYGFGRGLFGRGPIAGSDTSYKKLHRLRSGQLVVSRLKAFEGALGIVPDAFDGWFLSPEFPTFRCVDDQLDPGYLDYICRWPEFWAMLRTTSKGIGARRERVHAEDLLKLQLRVPPISDQRIAVSRLDRMQEVLTAEIEPQADANELTVKALLDTGLHEALEDLRRRSPEFARLGDLGTWSSGGTPSAKEPNYYGGEIPWAVIGDLNGGLVMQTERTLTRLGVEQSSAKIVPPGTVLVAMYGSIGKLGRAGVELTTNQAIATCRPARDVSGEYLMSLLRCLRLELVKLGQGGAQQNISQGLLKSVVVPKPAPAEQSHFVASVSQYLEGIDKISRTMQHRRELVQSLLPAALNQAFADLN